MAVSDATREALFERAGGRCECTKSFCIHHYPCERCHVPLLGPWEAYHRVAGGPDTLDNLMAMCQRCHRNTRSYGLHRILR